MKDLSFYKGRRVFITGHTGFKGSWLCRILVNAGAQVTGYSLEPPTAPSLFSMAGLEGRITSVIGDIRDFDALKKTFDAARPEIVLHLAAQPLVRDSYERPRYTYETNVMGTVNILECVRCSSSVKSFLNVTTDKVYKNNEWVWGYRENEPLDGYDPYSNSKSCSELVTHSYKSSFFDDRKVAVSTARAGNVIAQKQYEDIRYAGWYNVGPDDCDCLNTGDLVSLFCTAWGRGSRWVNKSDGGPHEANFLKLDSSKLKSTFGWKPTWHVEEAVKRVVQWTRVYFDKGNVPAEMDREIHDFMEA